MDSTTLGTPAGPLSLVVDGDLLAAAGFCPVATLESRLRTGSRPRADLGAVSAAVRAYLDGDLRALDPLEVGQRGTRHQQAVWAALRAVPAGSTVTYGELAGRLGRTASASRAVGSACAANLVAPVVPCHRVIRGNGTLGGYYYGLAVKRWLLEHERRHARAAA
jgi:methylated-DNA-[protein]-cysteine S-methyltransferase